MAQQYANQQPQGFKNHVEKIAVVGAAGQVGKFIVEELLKGGKHTVTAITRPDSSSKFADGVLVKKVNYDEQQSLVDALQGQDVLIITMSVTAPPDTQLKLLEAAAAANVPWVLPNWWGGDSTNEELGNDTHLLAGFQKATALIEKLNKSSWIGVACGFWYEYSLSTHAALYGFDFVNRSVTFFDSDGKTKINTSTWVQTGRGTAALLSLKILPDDETDKSTTLSSFRNSTAYVSSFRISQHDMFDSVLRVTGTQSSDWTVHNEDPHARFAEGQKELQGGSRLGFAKLLYARVFYPDGSGDFESKHGLSNDVLGLPKEDLDEATKRAVKTAEENGPAQW